MKTPRHELIKQHIDSFPVLPVTVTRLMTVTSAAECSIEDVVNVILTDQSLCLTILKIANSALFGRPKKVDSIKTAVSILGSNEVQRIALTKALVNSFSRLAHQHKAHIDKFWEHSFVCGMVSKVIAQDLHFNSDTAFMGGLIHDIGKLIMLQTFTDDYSLDWLTLFTNENRQRDELKMFSFSHDIVGGQLLEQWGFPEALVTAVAYHHRPGEAATEKAIAFIIQLSDMLSFYCCNPTSLGEDSILTAMHSTLPNLRSQWQNCGLPLEDAAVTEWFNWLLTNYEQGCKLKEAFSA